MESFEHILEVARRLKLKRIRISTGNMSLDADFPEPEKPQFVAFEQGEPKVSLPTEDELLYWSTDYTPDVKASAPE